jgi:hypothetical protein
MKKDFFKQFEHAILTKEMTSTIGGSYPSPGGGGAGPGSGKCCSTYCFGQCFSPYSNAQEAACRSTCSITSGCNYFC